MIERFFKNKGILVTETERWIEVFEHVHNNIWRNLYSYYKEFYSVERSDTHTRIMKK